MTIGGGIIQHTHLSAASGGILPAEASAMRLIQSVVANNDAQIDLDLSAFDHYMITVQSVHPSLTPQDFRCRVSIAGVFQTANYSYIRTLLQQGVAPGAPPGSDVGTEIQLNTGQFNAGPGRANFTMHAYNLRQTVDYKIFQYHTVYDNNGAAALRERLGGGYYRGSVAAIDGIRFYYSVGNIAGGRFSVYAIHD